MLAIKSTRWEAVAISAFENASFGVDTRAQLFVLSEDKDGFSLAAASFFPPEMFSVD